MSHSVDITEGIPKQSASSRTRIHVPADLILSLRRCVILSKLRTILVSTSIMDSRPSRIIRTTIYLSQETERVEQSTTDRSSFYMDGTAFEASKGVLDNSKRSAFTIFSFEHNLKKGKKKLFRSLLTRFWNKYSRLNILCSTGNVPIVRSLPQRTHGRL